MTRRKYYIAATAFSRLFLISLLLPSACAFAIVPPPSAALSRSSLVHASTTSSNNIIEEEDSSSTSSSVQQRCYSPNSSIGGSRNGSSSIFSSPPNLQPLLHSLASLKSGSDIRGTFVNHKCSGEPIANVSHLLKEQQQNKSLLTPFAAHCFGVAFARWSLLSSSSSSIQSKKNRHGGSEDNDDDDDDALIICVGRDPRVHGERIADSFARGAEGVHHNSRNKKKVKVVYTGIATTPSMYEFVRANKCHAAVMITASHLPEEKNGLKFFSKDGGLTKHDIDELILLAQEEARNLYDVGILPPSSENDGVLCSERVDYMPYYKETLRRAILREVSGSSSSSSSSPSLQSSSKPLSDINIVLNPGNGAGCFFVEVLRDLGAYVEGSIHLTPDGTFPATFGVPNPEKNGMVEETARACEACNADIGIMFDTDADRAGFILPGRRRSGVLHSDDDGGAKEQSENHYEPLNKNRLIALLGVIFSVTSPGCTIVTDSTTSEGLHTFLEGRLNLRHFRYLRGYANVIGKARELTESGLANAEVAIETSGHCAMKENGYVDDGTYTAVKIIGLLARTRTQSSPSRGSYGTTTTTTLLDMISDLDEMPYVEEFRVLVTDGSSATTSIIFDQLSQSLIEKCSNSGNNDWSLDEDNLEGVRARLSSSAAAADSGGFFMIRQSLHDPVISVQVEANSREEGREKVLRPLLELLSKHRDKLDYNSMEEE